MSGRRAVGIVLKEGAARVTVAVGGGVARAPAGGTTALRGTPGAVGGPTPGRAGRATPSTRAFNKEGRGVLRGGTPFIALSTKVVAFTHGTYVGQDKSEHAPAAAVSAPSSGGMMGLGEAKARASGFPPCCCARRASRRAPWAGDASARYAPLYERVAKA